MNGQHHHAHSNLLEYDPVFGLSTQQQLTAASLDVGGTLATLTAFSASSVANSPMDYTVIAGECMERREREGEGEGFCF